MKWLWWLWRLHNILDGLRPNQMRQKSHRECLAWLRNELAQLAYRYCVQCPYHAYSLVDGRVFVVARCERNELTRPHVHIYRYTGNNNIHTILRHLNVYFSCREKFNFNDRLILQEQSTGGRDVQTSYGTPTHQTKDVREHLTIENEITRNTSHVKQADFTATGHHMSSWAFRDIELDKFTWNSQFQRGEKKKTINNEI